MIANFIFSLIVVRLDFLKNHIFENKNYIKFEKISFIICNSLLSIGEYKDFAKGSEENINLVYDE